MYSLKARGKGAPKKKRTAEGMDGLDCIRHELTCRDRIEEVQGQEEINATTCVNRKMCIFYGIVVQKPAFGKRHGSAKSLGWLLEMQKVILQIPAAECNAFAHLENRCSLSKYLAHDIEWTLKAKNLDLLVNGLPCFPPAPSPLYVAWLASTQREEPDLSLNLMHTVLQIWHHHFHLNGSQKSTALFKYAL